MKKKIKKFQCPVCHGKGLVNCVLGRFTCGKCSGEGYTKNPDSTFVEDVLRSLKKKPGKKKK